MNPIKKKPTDENDQMQESDEDFSDEEESDEGEGIAPGNEVRVENAKSQTTTNKFCCFRKYKSILKAATRSQATSTESSSCFVRCS